MKCSISLHILLYSLPGRNLNVIRSRDSLVTTAIGCRSQWPRDLRHGLSSLARTLGSWLRIPLESWMPLCVYSVSMYVSSSSLMYCGRSVHHLVCRSLGRAYLVLSCIPDWTNLYETWCVYQDTWAHLNGVLHKSPPSVCVFNPVPSCFLYKAKDLSASAYRCWATARQSLSLLSLLGNGSINTFHRNEYTQQQKNYCMCICVGLSIPLLFLGNNSVRKFSRQQRILGGVVFYGVRVVSKAVCVSVYPIIVAKQRIGKHVPVTRRNRWRRCFLWGSCHKRKVGN
jgi:hypothetical protein